jgi:methylated-DNA-[protein]-cysteine S-methyltransferase
MIIYQQNIPSPFGELTLGATNQGLCFAGFNNKSLAQFVKKHQVQITWQKHQYLDLATTQLNKYFAGKLKEFTIPLDLYGTPFQIQVWQTLITIPYGKTISYKQEATQMHKPTAYRAVANANGKNSIIIIIPCHRVIATGGGIGGYSSGLDKKRFLLNLEHTNG